MTLCSSYHGHDRDDCSVHGHRHRHLVQRYVVKEDLHVLHRVNGHSSHAHVSTHPLVVRVVTLEMHDMIIKFVNKLFFFFILLTHDEWLGQRPH